MERIWAVFALLILVVISVIKGYLGVNESTTTLITIISGALLGYYFGTAAKPTRSRAPPPGGEPS